MIGRNLYSKISKCNREFIADIGDRRNKIENRIELNSAKSTNRREYFSRKYSAIIRAVLTQIEHENENLDINSEEGITSIKNILLYSKLCGKIYKEEDIPELINAVRREGNAAKNRKINDDRDEK